MPKLIAEMKVDLSKPEQSLIRDFYVTKKTWIINASKPTLMYYYEDQPDLDNKVVVLVNHGYVMDTSGRNRPLFRMTEEFVELVLKT